MKFLSLAKLCRCCLGLVISFCASPHLYAQEKQSSEVEVVEAVRLEAQNDELPMLLRIPATWIARSVNRDFEHKSDVDQIILGTRSRGTSHCKGKVTCVVEENPASVTILCSISGTVESKTCGVNGPAIIQSTAVTHYTSTKRLTFDGRVFACTPASTSSCTHVTITGVGSSLPRLRGRLVTRVAAKRAQQSLSQVEAIVKSQTEAELCQRIDEDFEARIKDLNSQFQSKLSILKYFPSSKHPLQLRSRQDGVEIALGHSSSEFDEKRRELIGDALEIWLRSNESVVANQPLTKVLFKKAPGWLSTYFAETPLFLQVDERKWGVEFGEKWIVVKLHP